MGTRDNEKANQRAEIERLEKRLAAATSSLGKLAGFIRPGMTVWYESRPGQKHAATVAGEPMELGAGQVCVALRDLDEAYVKENGRSTVKAAATWCLEPREVPVADDTLTPERYRAIADPLIEEEGRMLSRAVTRATGGTPDPTQISESIKTTLQSFGQRLVAACLRLRELDAETPPIAPAPFDILEAAWGVIANAGGGNWANESAEWQTAAKAWRERYHRVPRNPETGGVAEIRMLRDAAARIVSAIPGCGPLPSLVDEKYVDDVIAQLALALVGDRSMRRGREAEELRSGIERLISEAETDAIGSRTVATFGLQKLIDRVDARDSLAFVEKNEADATRYRRLRVLGCAPGSSLHLENRAVLTFTNLDKFVDDDLKAHPSRGEATDPVLSHIELEHAIGTFRVALRGVLRSAVPNAKEHPTMFAAWKEAEEVLGEPRHLRMARNLNRGDTPPDESIAAVHAAHRTLEKRRAADLLLQWQQLNQPEGAAVVPSLALCKETMWLLSDLAGVPDGENKGALLQTAISELRKAVYCLSLEVPREVYKAINEQTERAISLIPYAPMPPMGPPLAITEESGIHRGWYTWRPSGAGLPEAFAFIDTITHQYKHDIFTVLHAMAAAALCAARAVASVHEKRMGKISGAANLIPLIFVRNFMGRQDPIGLRFYDDMLYPQHADKWRTLPLDTFRWLQEQAKAKLAQPELKTDDPEVRKHWQNIVDGEVPFGYRVKD